ncbi:MAG: hypothetical protein J6Z08_04880 [Elusimicrobiales bacterium]|nr:hypothetical protein [Elusimicrobiales bacterium]
MKKNNRKKAIRTDLTRFLTSEEGKVVKGDVVKMAVSLGLIGIAAQDVFADSAEHSNSFHNAGYPGGAYHDSGHASHSSHNSHGSHGQW